jgi:hypothetical protein
VSEVGPAITHGPFENEHDDEHEHDWETQVSLQLQGRRSSETGLFHAHAATSPPNQTTAATSCGEAKLARIGR